MEEWSGLDPSLFNHRYLDWGVDNSLEISRNPYDKSEISYAWAKNPFEIWEISYA